MKAETIKALKAQVAALERERDDAKNKMYEAATLPGLQRAICADLDRRSPDMDDIYSAFHASGCDVAGVDWMKFLIHLLNATSARRRRKGETK